MRTSTFLAISIRVLVSLSTRTFFQPDEYFQSLEPAHHLVFGYGHLTWEWLTAHPVRSIVYPAINVPIFWILKVTGLAESKSIGEWLLIACPKVVHGCLAALTDIYVGEVARVALGHDYVSSAHFISLTSLFHALALSRSLSNSLETSLSTIAFAYYPWDASTQLSPQLIFNRTRLRKMIAFSALACMIRPTNAVIWAFLYANLFWAIHRHQRAFLMIARDITSAGLLASIVLVLMDSLYFGRLTITPLNFLRANLSSVSLFYGANPWHYYITQAIPILLTTALPFTLHGIWISMRTKSARENNSLKIMLVTVLWTVSVYSFAGHKEWRFLHPILPILHIFATKSLVDLVSGPSRPEKRPTKQKSRPKPKPQALTFIHRYFKLPNVAKRHLTLLLATLPVSIYLVLFYCSAPISVLSFLRAIPRNELNSTTIGMLMPCHSTPGQAFLHREELANGRMWALGCEPPLNHQNLSTYRDQTTVFFDSPMDYLLTYFPAHVKPSFPVSSFPTSIPGAPTPVLSSGSSTQPPYPWRHEWPRYFIFFGQLLLEPGVRGILEEQGYQEVWKAGREWEGEGHRKGGVKVWEWSKRHRTFIQ